MKIASYIVMALGVVALIFAIVCMVAAGEVIDTVDMFYSSYQLMGLDHVECFEYATGVTVEAFTVFAYYARFWLLGGGIGLIVVGAALLAAAILLGKKRAGGANYVSMPSLMVCPGCGSSVAVNSAFCTNCGYSMTAKPVSIKPVSVDCAPAAAFCMSCGAANEPGSRFCMSCGAAISGAPADTSAAAAPAAAAPAAPAAGGREGAGTIKATPVTGDSGTVRLDTRGTSSGTVRIDTRAAVPAKSGPASDAPAYEEEAPASSGTVLLSVREEIRPAPMKSRLSKAGDL